MSILYNICINVLCAVGYVNCCMAKSICGTRSCTTLNKSERERFYRYFSWNIRAFPLPHAFLSFIHFILSLLILLQSFLSLCPDMFVQVHPDTKMTSKQPCVQALCQQIERICFFGLKNGDSGQLFWDFICSVSVLDSIVNNSFQDSLRVIRLCPSLNTGKYI
jgi:hypothetical protein